MEIVEGSDDKEHPARGGDSVAVSPLLSLPLMIAKHNIYFTVTPVKYNLRYRPEF